MEGEKGKNYSNHPKSEKLPKEHVDETAPAANFSGKECPPGSKTGGNQPGIQSRSTDTLATPAESEATKTHDTCSTSSTALSTLRADLNLKPKYSLKQARTIDNRTLTDDQLTCLDQYIFNKLMIADHNVLELPLNKCKTNNNYDSDDSEDEVVDADEIVVHPMDALISIFYGSDISLRRYLAVKLSECQLSVPFLLPNLEETSEKVTILLSALENITKSWSSGLDDNKNVRHVFATEHQFPVVSFIRIDQTTMSKSSLINKIMSDGSTDHRFFFHKDMKGGNIERKVVDGLVELSWYLPGENREQILQQEICFANLRGDAANFKIQLNVILKISSVVCVVLPSECPVENLTDIIEKATVSGAKLVVIFCEKAHANEKSQMHINAEAHKKYLKELKNKYGKMVSLITKAKKPNEYDFLQTIRRSIQKNINNVTAKPLVDLASWTSESGIQHDENQTNTLFSKGADNWLKMKIEDAKDLLSLQKNVPEFAKLERELHRQKHRDGKSVEEYQNEIQERIGENELARKESFRHLDERIINCFKSLVNMNETERNQALNKVKHQLDKTSLEVITKLHQEYCTLSLDLQRQETRRDKGLKTINTQAPEEKRLKELEESISKHSFGLEHIIRELAQLYEIEGSKYDYAGVAAEMLLSGQPLEILDGDSFYIPPRWLDAVFDKLEDKTKNAKIFIISVVGIQSSGKSTMLNTMFGLEFPVSAGRCTRGVFASLIPVSDSLKTVSEFDYVLVIDTEGLRGSADPQLRVHDNELATFAIGVADLTIVNIFGENHNTMKDFLEIAVHAFLKMKLVEEKKKKSCKFVHQNVTATNATEKLVGNRFNLRQGLDEMTKLAAIQEKCEDKYNKFNDIISFNENEDVFYLPSLLKGNPPMAPVNPKYGEAVQKIKKEVIAVMCSKRSAYHSVFQFRRRVINLWKAILKEDFIFSLRNTIEVRARMSLDRKYFEKSVAIMVAGMAELEKRIMVALERCSAADEREKRWADSRTKIDEEAEDLAGEMAQEMNEFFETDEDKTTVEQWKEHILTKIKEEKEIHILEVKKKCLSTFNHLQRVQDIKDKGRTYEEELLENAKSFITSAYDIEDAEKMNEDFEEQWQKWIEKVPPCQEIKIDINKEIVDYLSTKVPVLSQEIREKINKQGHIISNYLDSKGDIFVDDLTFEINWKGFFKMAPSVVQNAEKSRHLPDAKRIRKFSITKALHLARSASSESGIRFNCNYIIQMTQIVITTIEEATKKFPFKFKNSLQCDTLLHTFAKAYPIFHEMEERFCQERDIRSQMEKDLRPRLEQYFLNVCTKMGKEMLAATSFCDVLENQIESALNSSMGPLVTRKISKENKFQNKSQFHARVLIQLGEDGKFGPYIPYLENQLGFLRTKLMESIEKFCLERIPASVDSLLKNEVKRFEDEVLSAISKASDETEKMNTQATGSRKLDFWIERFVEECPSLAIKKEMFSVATMENLENIDLFRNEVNEKVSSHFESLNKLVVDLEMFRQWNPSPVDCLSNTMFSCICSCPFCETLCDHAIPNHDVHSALSHRPLGIIGYKEEKTRKLATDDCTERIGGGKRFQNPDTDWEWHLYKEYRSVNDYYKSWNICKNSTNKQRMYWQWFMAKFSHELAKFHGAEMPYKTFWKRIIFDKVKKNLQEEYLL
ncbi:interferon-induced very large GTPase 1-like [Dendronephthya gigantea]|uniref:interferon-induced very large GTPase 1-like n=1 Tax=Dendronephthya gigantea TaxID=151771 RepID=UPI00106A053B|nr:interferon-induced very large GTPase 1-like [Dendronephthya gigantea]XP_028415063.1 interferon-induced very large GTPase 1-like [Dendronephthya gigantea]